MIIYMHQYFLWMHIVKSLVLLTFLSLPGTAPQIGNAEYFDNEATCQARMQDIRAQLGGKSGTVRCSCHPTVEEVDVEASDAI